MQKHLLIVILFASTVAAHSQPRFTHPTDTLLFKQHFSALKNAIDSSTYIVEAKFIKGDYYYIKQENQTYFRTFIKVNKVMRGASIADGDTITCIWKQEGNGEGPFTLASPHSAIPLLWYDEKRTESCLFLTDSKFATETEADKWSHYKKVTYVPTNVGYFAALYDAIYDAKIGVFIKGILFDKKSDWYTYLKQYPGIKVPEDK